MADFSSAVPRIAVLVEFNYENLEVGFCHTIHIINFITKLCIVGLVSIAKI